MHFILTRFNVRAPYGGERADDPAWTEHRLALFETYCLPSIRAQTNQEFRWLVFFDPERTAAFSGRVQRYASYANFEAVFVRDASEVSGEALRRAPNTGTFITTRIDNDDGFAVDTIDKVKAGLEAEEHAILHFSCGLVVGQNKAQLHFASTPNPFISLKTTVSRGITVLDASHVEAGRLAPVKYCHHGPAWLQVVHDRNVYNVLSADHHPLRRAKQIAVHYAHRAGLPIQFLPPYNFWKELAWDGEYLRRRFGAQI